MFELDFYIDNYKLILLGVILFWNLITFTIMKIDKRRAQKGKYRISEKKIMYYAFFFGASGAYMGLKVFKHKTQHKKFVYGLPILIIMNMAIIILLGVYLP